jgi:ABC-2 type transport system ATP-binding protein
VSIKLSSVTKIYGEQIAVNKISFEVNKGEIVGFLGPNGAGKSTTMKMLTGFIEADGGELEVCGIRVKYGHTETKEKIGYLPEANPLYADMYVREYLHFISNIHHVAHQKQRIEEVIGLAGLTAESNKKIAQLSKGYKQRVGLAAALVHDPEVLILDEPTSGLDPNQLIEIRDVIRRLGKNKTVLFSSHIMQEVEAICDRVVIIHKGNIVANDRLDNIREAHYGMQSVSVSFNDAIDISKLRKLKGASDVQARDERNFVIVCNNAEALKKELLSLSIADGLDISALRTDSRNLEAVFKSLTT